MGQQFLQWRSGEGEKLWLSALVDTMERMSRRDYRGLPCDQSVRIEVLAHLARPASLPPASGSHFGWRN
jgi:hypothetical protein